LGGNRWQTFRRVVLPLSMPGVFTGVIVIFLSTMGAIVTPILLGGIRQHFAGTQIYQEVVYNFNLNKASAWSISLLTLSLVVLVLLKLVERRMLKNEEVGSMRNLHPLTRQLGIALLPFLPAPIDVVVGGSFTSAGHIQFPPGELSIRWYIEAVLDPRWPAAFFTSLWIAAATAVVITAISFLTAFYCIRYAPGIAGILETMIFSPLFFPHAALGVAMVAVVASLGLLGTGTGIVLAHLICTLPFAYRPMFISLKKIDGELIEAAQVLGASEWRIMRDVILPLSKS